MHDDVRCNGRWIRRDDASQKMQVRGNSSWIRYSQPEKLTVARRATNRAVVQPALVPEQAVISNTAIKKNEKRRGRYLVHSPPGAVVAGTCGRFVLAAASPAFLGACLANASACGTMIGFIAQRAITKVIVHAQAVLVACGYHTARAARQCRLSSVPDIGTAQLRHTSLAGCCVSRCAQRFLSSALSR